MATLVETFSVDKTKFLINDISANTNTYFFWVGGFEPWSDDTQPPVANGSYDSIEINLYNSLVYGKRIIGSDVAALTTNYTWANNTVYAQFDSEDSDIFSKNFYCVTSSNNVYKCIFNNNNKPSTVQPQSKQVSSVFQTADGYIWKYMFTIDNTNAAKFMSNTYIPVLPNTYVTSNAIPGTIYAIQITNAGSGYLTNSDNLQGISNSTTIILGNTASNVSGIYNYSSVYLPGYYGQIQLREIINYDGQTKIATLNNPLNITTNLRISNNNGTFNVNDTVTQPISILNISLESNTIGVGANCVQTDTGAYGVVVSKIQTNTGNTVYIFNNSNTNFSNNLPISGQGTSSTIASGTVSCTSGSNTVTGVSMSFTSSMKVNEYIQIGSEFRRVTSIANDTVLYVDQNFTTTVSNVNMVIVSVAASVSQANNVNASGIINSSDMAGIQFIVSNVTSNFVLGETVTGSFTQANGVVAFSNSTVLNLTQVQGTFNINDKLTGSTSNTTVSIVSINNNKNVTLTNVNSTFILNSPVVTSSGGNAYVYGISFLPDVNSSYVVSPSVSITGDGNGCQAYCTVNTITTGLQSIVVFANGNNYTNAVVTISSNTLYGSNASARALLSPIKGHGYDPIKELGASTLGITTTLQNGNNDNFYLPVYGSYRQFGIMKNPLYNDITLTLGTPLTGTFNILSKTGTFIVNEAVYQQSTNACATVISSNTSTLVVKNIVGTFNSSTSGNTNTYITGINSGASINANNFVYNYFNIVNNSVQTISQAATGASGILVSANSTAINLTNVSGVFVTGNVITDTSTNTSANVTSINTANNTLVFAFDKFKQVARVTLTSNTSAFSNGEMVTQITGSGNNTGFIISTSSDLDFVVNTYTGNFVVNEVISQSNTLATATLLWSNSTYIKLTSVSGVFNSTDTITGQTSNVHATPTALYSVLNIGNTPKNWINSNSTIIGANTSSIGYNTGVANTITIPDLVRNTGNVVYIENVSPIVIDANMQQTLKLTINF